MLIMVHLEKMAMDRTFPIFGVVILLVPTFAPFSTFRLVGYKVIWALVMNAIKFQRLRSDALVGLGKT